VEKGCTETEEYVPLSVFVNARSALCKTNVSRTINRKSAVHVTHTTLILLLCTKNLPDLLEIF